MLPGINVPPSNPNHILELSNNDSAASSCPPKKTTGSSTSNGQRNHVSVDNTVDDDEDEEAHPPLKKKPQNSVKAARKKPKAKPTVLLSSESDSDQTDTDNDNNDKNPSETPEEELGEFFRILIANSMVTYRDALKNGWPKIGHPLFMAFSIRVLKLKPSKVVVAMSSDVLHLFAKERA